MDKVYIEITSCQNCPNVDHSGGFTPGGPKTICGHSDAAEKATKDKVIDFPLKNAMGETVSAGKHHWIHRVVDEESIAMWCPLRKESE